MAAAELATAMNALGEMLKALTRMSKFGTLKILGESTYWNTARPWRKMCWPTSRLQWRKQRARRSTR